MLMAGLCTADDKKEAEALFKKGLVAGNIGNQSHAFDLFQKAAEKGSIKALSALGEMYITGLGVEKNSKRAIEVFTKAAEQGHPNAQYNLGVCYYEGLVVKKDLKKALHYKVHGIFTNKIPYMRKVLKEMCGED